MNPATWAEVGCAKSDRIRSLLACPVDMAAGAVGWMDPDGVVELVDDELAYTDNGKPIHNEACGHWRAIS